MPCPTQQPPPLLKLPSEIRNHIWRYIVIQDDCITFSEYMIYARSPETGLKVGNPVSIRQDGYEPRQTSLLAIAFTCRQLYLEVTPIYYGENVFCPSYLDYLITGRVVQSFALAIGPTNASTITQLGLYEPFCLPEHYLHELPNLKCVYFDESDVMRASNKMIWFATQHKPLRIIYHGEEWGPDKWRLNLRKVNLRRE